MKRRVNIKNLRFCAFCKYWYDVANTHILPITPKSYIWEYEHGVKSMCLQRNIYTFSQSNCAKYDCKIAKI